MKFLTESRLQAAQAQRKIITVLVLYPWKVQTRVRKYISTRTEMGRDDIDFIMAAYVVLSSFYLSQMQR